MIRLDKFQVFLSSYQGEIHMIFLAVLAEFKDFFGDEISCLRVKIQPNL
ncbi:hypothetical protein ACPF04_05420 [Campylobacter sp. MOP51]